MTARDFNNPSAVVAKNYPFDTTDLTAASGQITVTTAGTEVQGTNIALPNGVFVKALPANTGVMYVGNDGAGAVSSSTGFPLSAGEMILIQVENLNEIWFDASVNGEKVAWIKA